MKATLIVIQNDAVHAEAMVRKLRDRFHISADLLVSPARIRGIAA
jgi:hypothetical protein